MSKDESSIETVVAEAVKAKVQTMIVEALGDPTALVRNLVAEALTQKVRNARTYQDEPVINGIIREAIIEEAKKAMKEWVDEQRPAIRAEIKRRLVADKTNIADALIGSIIKSADSHYGVTVTIDPKRDSE